MTKRELQDSVRKLLQTNPSRSIELCLEIYENYPDEFNDYDTINLLQAVRKAGKTNIQKLPEIVEKFKENELVYGLCGWYIFDNYIKSKSPQQILQFENIICQYLPLLSQKDVSIDNKYPCPYFLIISNLWSAHSNNLFNARKIFYYCELVNPNFLSKKSSRYTTDEGKTVEQASSFEEYYQYYTKACDKLDKAEEAITACRKVLSSVSEFHYDNDLWFKMRIARAFRKLKDFDAAEKQYLEIINSKAGCSKYFLFKEYSELLYYLERYEESWHQSLRSGIVLHDVKFCSGLILHQSRLLARLNRINEAKKFAKIIYAGIQENLWKNSNDHQKLIAYFEISEVAENVKELFKKLYGFYKDELYNDKPLTEGKLVYVHKNGKFGKVKCADGSTINFTKNSFNCRTGRLDKLVGATVTFVSDYDFKAEPLAENIKILTLEKRVDIIEAEFTGMVQNTVDFGVFIDFDSDKRGLAHKSGLKSNFKEEFHSGNRVRIRVIKQTEKGYSLEILEKL